jgi:hypothetical protein
MSKIQKKLDYWIFADYWIGLDCFSSIQSLELCRELNSEMNGIFFIFFIMQFRPSAAAKKPFFWFFEKNVKKTLNLQR